MAIKRGLLLRRQLSTIIHEYKRHVTKELTLLARKHVPTLIYCINSLTPTHHLEQVFTPVLFYYLIRY